MMKEEQNDDILPSSSRTHNFYISGGELVYGDGVYVL